MTGRVWVNPKYRYVTVPLTDLPKAREVLGFFVGEDTTVGGPMGTHNTDISIHRYVSTACVHEQHTGCRIVCKFCEQICLCQCHWEVTPTEHTVQVYEVERNRRFPEPLDNDGEA